MNGDDGLEFVEFAEGPTKTRPGGLSANSRQFQAKMFQTGEGKCQVALFRQYISRRPPNLRTRGPFYLSIKYNRRADDEIWYKVQPMGENKINSMMKSMRHVVKTSSGLRRRQNSGRFTVVAET